MWHLGIAQQWKAFKVQKGFIFKRNGHWSAAFKGKDNSRAWRLDLCLRSKSLSLTLGGQYNIKATKRLRLQRVCKCKWCGGILQTQHSPHSRAQAQASIWSVGFTPVKTTCVYLSLSKPFRARAEEKKESGGGLNLLIPQSSNVPLPNRLKSKHTKGQCGGDNQKIPDLSQCRTHHVEHKEWDTVPTRGHPPHYPSLWCRGLLCHILSREVVNKL